MQKKIEIHGHRGARGVYPENTIPSFLYAVKAGVTSIEMDVVISKDKKVVVSHEPWMSYKICTYPSGEKIKMKDQPNLYELTYEEIKAFDCGSIGNKKFPEQKKQAAYKPLLSEVIQACNDYTKQNNLPGINFNIEMKYEERWKNVFHPDEVEFTNLVVQEVLNSKIQDRTLIKSFDVNPLRHLNELKLGVKIGFLVENRLSVESNLNNLGFIPDYYNPYYKVIKPKTIKDCKSRNIKILAWTVNEIMDMKKILELGVDGIITDYPDRAKWINANT